MVSEIKEQVKDEVKVNKGVKFRLLAYVKGISENLIENFINKRLPKLCLSEKQKKSVIWFIKKILLKKIKSGSLFNVFWNKYSVTIPLHCQKEVIEENIRLYYGVAFCLQNNELLPYLQPFVFIPALDYAIFLPNRIVVDFENIEEQISKLLLHTIREEKSFIKKLKEHNLYDAYINETKTILNDFDLSKYKTNIAKFKKILIMIRRKFLNMLNQAIGKLVNTAVNTANVVANKVNGLITSLAEKMSINKKEKNKEENKEEKKEEVYTYKNSDEGYRNFVNIIADLTNMSKEEIEKITDGSLEKAHRLFLEVRRKNREKNGYIR